MAGTSGPKNKRKEFGFWSKIFNVKFKKLSKMTDYELYLLTKETQEDFEKNSEKYRTLLNDHLKDEFSIPAAQGKESSIFTEIQKLMAMPQDQLYFKVKEVKMKYEEKPIKLDDLPQLATLLLQAFPRTQENVNRILAPKTNPNSQCRKPAAQRCARPAAQRCARPVAASCARPAAARPLRTRPPSAVKPSAAAKARRSSTAPRRSRTTSRKRSSQN